MEFQNTPQHTHLQKNFFHSVLAMSLQKLNKKKKKKEEIISLKANVTRIFAIEEFCKQITDRRNENDEMKANLKTIAAHLTTELPSATVAQFLTNFDNLVPF